MAPRQVRSIAFDIRNNPYPFFPRPAAEEGVGVKAHARSLIECESAKFKGKTTSVALPGKIS